jgi:hypothetical protein
MTPLEIAKKNQEKWRTKPPCYKCPKSERVEGTLYCGVDGKIILPRFEHICCCLGKKLIDERSENGK